MKKIPSRRTFMFGFRALVFTVLYVGVNVCNAQLSENFTDGDYTTNPSWTPDNPANWIVQNGLLRSNSTTPSSTFYISTPSTQYINTQWELLVTLAFNTSGANYVDIYLTADRPDLTNVGINGYFVRIGNTADDISLYKVVNGITTQLINGLDGITNTASSQIRLKVIHDERGWTLMRDATGGVNYVSEGTSPDNSLSGAAYMGFKITQSTASFFGKHYFDDIYVGDIITDKQPPAVVTVTPLAATVLEIAVDEKVEAASAQSPDNFLVNEDNRCVEAVLQPDQQRVVLTFLKPFKDNSDNVIRIDQLADLAGNVMTTTMRSFYYYDKIPAGRKDVVVTEIFADPSPVIGLPETEYIELYNRSNHTYDLSDWSLSDGSSTARLSSWLLRPHQYVVVATASAGFPQNLIRLSGMPTLNNSGDLILLKNADGQTIDSLRYADTWYGDDDKKQGGWSLELIDPDNVCAEESNWTAADDPAGGTPGRQNSVYALNPDLTPPQLLQAVPLTSNVISLLFNEKLETTIPAATDFEMVPDVNVISVRAGATSRELLLQLSTALEPSRIYTLKRWRVRDCAGNLAAVTSDDRVLGLPEEAEPGDVLINEILFNPRPFGADFVELYNQSSKFLNLKGWTIGKYEQDILTDAITISQNDYLLLPQHYLVLTIDPATVRSQYPQHNEQAFLLMKAMPSLPDDEGSVSVASPAKLLDHLVYTDKMHSPFLRDTEGVSLERIASSLQTQDAGNWQSSNETNGFATPGRVNSNARTTRTDAGTVWVEPEIFQAHHAQAQIIYSLDKGGQMADVIIYDLEGKEVKVLARQVTLATTGAFKWDGDRHDGSRAEAGYYVVWMQLWDATGAVKTYRRRVILAPGN